MTRAKRPRRSSVPCPERYRADAPERTGQVRNADEPVIEVGVDDAMSQEATNAEAANEETDSGPKEVLPKIEIHPTLQ